MKSGSQHRRRNHLLVGRGHEREPLIDYALLICTFLMVTGQALVRDSMRDRSAAHIPLTDAVLLGLATARLSRLVTREKIMRVVRAPFTEVVEGASLDEVKERPRGHGFVRAMGELLTCPRCFGMWVSAALTLSYGSAPEKTRMASTILAVALVSDLTHQRFARAHCRRILSTANSHVVENTARAT